MLDAVLRKRLHAGLELNVRLVLGPECGVVFGRSGAGKTSLLHLIAGLLVPDSGQITLGGEPLFDGDRRVHTPLRLRRISLILQDDCLFPHLDSRANIAYGLRAWSRVAARERVAEVARLCGVEHLLDRSPNRLSGGERQRVGLARAIAPRPRLLLCDEPVSALDLPARFELIDRLRAVQRAEQVPLLFVTHSPAEAMQVGDRLYRLEGGTITAEGRPLDVLTSAGLGAWAWSEPARNVLAGRVEHQDPRGGETRVRLDGAGGPVLCVPYHSAPTGAPLRVLVRSDEILLGCPQGVDLASRLSARNVIPGRVERVLPHDGEAEVVVETGDVLWTVSVVGSTVETLSLQTGAEVFLIIKARSCQVLDAGSPA
jgi:molybdate transport system ATP-binding protein